MLQYLLYVYAYINAHVCNPCKYISSCGDRDIHIPPVNTGVHSWASLNRCLLTQTHYTEFLCWQNPLDRNYHLSPEIID